MGASVNPLIDQINKEDNAMSLVKDAPHSDITYKIIGAAMEVHNKLGPGHKEIVYQKALSAKMLEADLSFEEEKSIEIFIDGTSVGLLYLDHLVEGVVVVEEKAFSHLLTNEEIAQVITYLAATGLSVGLLLNFGRKRLEFKRIFPPKKLEGWRDRIKRYLWVPKSQ
jgi:GxxExxY protein